MCTAPLPFATGSAGTESLFAVLWEAIGVIGDKFEVLPIPHIGHLKPQYSYQKPSILADRAVDVVPQRCMVCGISFIGKVQVTNSPS